MGGHSHGCGKGQFQRGYAVCAAGRAGAHRKRHPPAPGANGGERAVGDATAADPGGPGQRDRRPAQRTAAAPFDRGDRGAGALFLRRGGGVHPPHQRPHHRGRPAAPHLRAAAEVRLPPGGRRRAPERGPGSEGVAPVAPGDRSRVRHPWRRGPRKPRGDHRHPAPVAPGSQGPSDTGRTGRGGGHQRAGSEGHRPHPLQPSVGRGYGLGWGAVLLPGAPGPGRTSAAPSPTR